MTVIYIDPGLRTNIGHNAESGRAIITELRQRGLDIMVLGNKTVREDLQRELGVIPFFTLSSYERVNVGGRSPEDVMPRLLAERLYGLSDLGRLSEIGPNDVIYVNTVLPPYLLALVDWLDTIPAGMRPRVVAELGTTAGADCSLVNGILQVHPRPAKTDPTAARYRAISRRWNEVGPLPLAVVTGDPLMSKAYEVVLGRQVHISPIPRSAITGCRVRHPASEPLIAWIGHQQWAKGYLLVPEIVTLLLMSGEKLRLLVQNAAMAQMEAITESLYSIAEADNRLELLVGPLSHDAYATLIDRIDIIVCPYYANHYCCNYSAVAAEAIANGAVLVAPADTTLSELLARSGGGGTLFHEWTAPSVCTAILEAVADFDRLAAAAATAASHWQDSHGPGPYVTRILEIASQLEG